MEGFLVLIVQILLVVVDAQTWGKALDSPYGPELKSCKENWGDISRRKDQTKVSGCYHKLLLAITPALGRPSGIPALNIRSLDPLHVLPEPINIGGNAGIVRANLTNLMIKGIRTGLTAEKSQVSFDPQTDTVILIVDIPAKALTITADYKATVDAGNFFGNQGENSQTASVTEGVLSGEAGNLRATLTTTLRKAKNGEYRVQSSQSAFETDALTLKFDPTKPGDPISGLLNTVMSTNESTLQVLEELKPSINAVLAHSLGALFHGGWKKLEQI